MEDSEEYGPALPPSMVAGPGVKSSVGQSHSKLLGPSIPAHLRKSTDSDDLSDEGQLMVKMESDEQSDNNTVGPMPSEMASSGDSSAQTAHEFEKRAKLMKDKLVKGDSGEPENTKRDEWMTELPPEMGKNFGLGNRQFSTSKSAAGKSEDKDRSSWTDTPVMKKEKESKGKKRKREREAQLSARDQTLHHQVEDYNKNKRSESLMDMHNKKQKKKKKKDKKEKKNKKKDRSDKGKKKNKDDSSSSDDEDEKTERVPFDREKDMKVQNIDDAQRKAFIKKSALLNTRFSFGESTQHFL